MNCEPCREMIPEYIENSLSEAAAREVRQHLDACDACRRELRDTRALLQAARRLPRHEPGDEAVLRIGRELCQAAAPALRTEFGPVLDVDDLAEYLRIEPAVLALYVDEIPHFELGGKLLFRSKSVDRWIAEREQLPAVEAGIETGVVGVLNL